VGADAHPGDDALPGDVWYMVARSIPAEEGKVLYVEARVERDAIIWP